MRPLELSSHSLARAIGVTSALVNDFANKKRGITADTALRLGRYFGTAADSWINLQKRFELETARRDFVNKLDQTPPRAGGSAP